MNLFVSAQCRLIHNAGAIFGSQNVRSLQFSGIVWRKGARWTSEYKSLCF